MNSIKHKIVFLDRISLMATLKPFDFPHEWVEYDTTSPEQTLERIQDATMIISNKVKIQREHLVQLKSLQLIAVCATGINNIDIDACKEFGVKVSNIRNYAIHTVPEHVFSFIFGLRRNLIAYRETLQQGKWQKSKFFCLFDHEIHDIHQTQMGIIGSGAIGDSVANIAKAFGMKVVFAERKSITNPNEVRQGHMLFEDVLKTSDIMSVHCPLTPETTNLIDTPEFNLMKPNALLINTARGGIVNESSLLNALKTKQIAGAGIDVLIEEPPIHSSDLLEANLPNLIITPHVAWASQEAQQILADQLVDIMNQFASQGILMNQVV